MGDFVAELHNPNRRHHPRYDRILFDPSRLMVSIWDAPDDFDPPEIVWPHPYNLNIEEVYVRAGVGSRKYEFSHARRRQMTSSRMQ